MRGWNTGLAGALGTLGTLETLGALGAARALGASATQTPQANKKGSTFIRTIPGPFFLSDHTIF